MRNIGENIAAEFGTIVTRDAMRLIGISGRTDNQRELSGGGIIPAMWARFTSERLVERIPARTGMGEIIAAYFDIETDDRGPYSFFIGMEVDSREPVPEGMIGLEVPAGRFLKVSTEWGSFRNIGIEAWIKLWASDELRRQRKFDVDLEVYGKDAANPDNGRFDIYVGL